MKPALTHDFYKKEFPRVALMLRTITRSALSLLLAASIPCTKSWSDTALTIGTFQSYPYHYKQNDSVVGDAAETVECIMNKINKPFKIEFYPRVRGAQLLKSGKLDALLAYHSFQTENLHSVASSPIVFERWNTYFTSKDGENSNLRWKSLLSRSKLGSVRGSSIDTWLINNQLPPKHRLSSFKQLLKMLHQDRIDAFVADEESTEETISSSFIGHNFSFNQKFITFSPLSVHFNNKKYADSQFLKLFNSHIASCRPKSLKLREDENKWVLDKAKEIFDQHINNDIIRNKVLKSNLSFPQEKFDDAQIVQLEKQWKLQKTKNTGDLVSSVVDSKESKLLRDVMHNTGGVILEIIVMNKHGFNISSTDITSDYYQGDEEKYQKTYLAGANSTHLSKVEFDDSANNFGAQVSFTLSNNGIKIGAITLTIDIYKAFL